MNNRKHKLQLCTNLSRNAKIINSTLSEWNDCECTRTVCEIDYIFSVIISASQWDLSLFFCILRLSPTKMFTTKLVFVVSNRVFYSDWPRTTKLLAKLLSLQSIFHIVNGIWTAVKLVMATEYMNEIDRYRMNNGIVSMRMYKVQR